MAVAVGAAIVVACMIPSDPVNHPGGDAVAKTTQRPIGVAAGSYWGIAWLPSGWLVLDHDGDPRLAMHRPWRVRPDGSEYGPIRLPDDASCDQTRYQDVSTLPDGRLGLVRWCVRTPPADPTSAPGSMYFMAYDLAAGRLDQLVAQPWRSGVNTYSWNPQLTRGMVSHSSDICASVAWLTPAGVQDTGLELDLDGKRWPLDELFRRKGSERCDDLGRADLPAWSPDGSRIALFASAPSGAGQGRLDAPWYLVFLDAEGRQPRPVLADVRHPRSLAWSPSGRWLAFGGEVASRGGGLWLYAPDDGSLRRLSDRRTDWLAWSPDGTQIAFIHDPDPRQQPPKQEVFVLTVPG